MYQSVCIVVQCVVHIHIIYSTCMCVYFCTLYAAGMSKQVAIERYLEKVCELECGVNSYRGYFEDKHVSVNVGCRHIQIIDSNQSTIHKLVTPAPYLCMVHQYVCSLCSTILLCYAKR